MRALALLLVLLGPLTASAQDRLTSAERMLMAVPATVVAVNVFFQGGEDASLLARGAVTTVASGLAVYGERRSPFGPEAGGRGGRSSATPPAPTPMRLALLLALITTSAAAQTPDSTAARRASSVRGDLVLGGVAAGATAVGLTFAALRVAGVEGDDRGWALVAYPVGVAAGVHLLAQRLGLDGAIEANVNGTLRGTLVGALGGLGVAAAGLAVAGGPFGGGDEGGGGALILVGVAVAALAPPYFAARGYRAPEMQPVVIVGPDGARAAGLSLRVAL